MSASVSISPAPSKTIFAFDLGKASLGEAVRDDSGIRHAASWLIPEKLAQRGPASESGTPASRYRMWKNREAHQAREKRLREILANAGVEVLQTKKSVWDAVAKKWKTTAADPRLLREFPAKDDDTCYTSCLLRIKLLHGEKLDGWQIHKALHSAIQRRGYDANVPWKNSRSAKKSADQEKEDGDTAQQADAFRAELEKMTAQLPPERAAQKPGFHFPCYFDAFQMGLWSPQKPDDTSRLRIDHNAAAARNRDNATDAFGKPRAKLTPPRALVIAELRALFDAAAKFFPKLDGADDEMEQAQYVETGEWKHVISQKIPRFDNRIIAKCALIPRLNVCKSVVTEKPAENATDAQRARYAESLLPSEVTFLMKLKNMRVQHPDKSAQPLTAAEIGAIFNDPKRAPDKLSFTATQWRKWCAAHNTVPVAAQEKIDKPRDGGRSRFCRPALKLLKALILSGKLPPEFHAEKLAVLNGNTDPKRGLIPDDLGFLLRMGDSWDSIRVPDQQFDRLRRVAEEKNRETAIRELISSVNDPIVRHRLETLWKRLRELGEKFGEPAHVVLEFVREDFMGEKAKNKLDSFQREREKKRKEFRAKAKKAVRDALKFELLDEQGGQCLYCGTSVGATPESIAKVGAEIEHIVPHALGGPDASVNKCVACAVCNTSKYKQTPYAWFHARNDTAGWDAYVKRVESRATSLRAKKVRLLTAPDAAEQVSRYTALAETAWIAKLSQTLVALWFGWPINDEAGQRRIIVASGGKTARIRRKYDLNSLLHPEACPADKDPAEWEEIIEKKNRDDDRHHALDAMVLSYLPAWTHDPNKARFFKFPEGVHRGTFETEIRKVVPAPLAFAKPVLEATIYGKRKLTDKNGTHEYGVKRVPLNSLAVKTDKGRPSLDLPLGKANLGTVVDPVIRKEVSDHITQNKDMLTLETWNAWCATYRRGGMNGPLVKKVLIKVAREPEANGYRDISKDGTGQLRRTRTGKGFASGGYFVIEISSPAKNGAIRKRYKIASVYSHTGKFKTQEQCLAPNDSEIAQNIRKKIQGFYQSGCIVEIKQPVKTLPAGKYSLNYMSGGKVAVTSPDGKQSLIAALTLFIAAGFRACTDS